MSSDESSSSDGDSSDYDASGPKGVRWELRRAMRYQVERRRERAKRENSSDCLSFISSESDLYSSFSIDLPLKQGDDVVTKLLELWTPPGSVKGPESA
jgi:hypothetical protein